MSQPYVGEIRMFAGNFAPLGWAFCNGQLMAISENDILFNLIGTTYGGDGQNTFALPNLQSRIAVHQGTGSGLSTRTLAQAGGVETVTLTTQQLPVHTHPALCSTAASGNTGNQSAPGGNIWAKQSSTGLYNSGPANTNMNSGAVSGIAGGNQPHDNMMPFLVVNFIISLFGIYPSPT